MSDLDLRRVPAHVAIIPDGNGRWAKLRGEERTMGHVRGTANVKEIVTFAKELGIQVLTIYAFSDENWQRPLAEVECLMDLLKQYLIQERETILKNKIQLRAIGTIERLPKPVLEELKKTIELSSQNQEMILNFAVSYVSHSEIIQAVQKISQDVLKGKLLPEDIDPKVFCQYLYTKDLPDPDLLIRTSGEMRISNFLLWQMAYTEFYSTPILWPDFNREEFLKALLEYQKRKRRFGLTED